MQTINMLQAKTNLSRLVEAIESGEEAIAHFRAAGYQSLPVEPEHAAAIEGLPKHHQDPFDRLRATQAQVEPMRLLTHDPMLAHYGDFVVPV